MLAKLPFLKTMRRDERGVAAIEFALIAPVAILVYCGFAELTMAGNAVTIGRSWHDGRSGLKSPGRTAPPRSISPPESRSSS